MSHDTPSDAPKDPALVRPDAVAGVADSDRAVRGDAGGMSAPSPGESRPGWLPANPRARGDEKLREVLEWICRFHYSTVPVLMELLGLRHFTNSTYFKRLVDRGLLKRVDVPTLKRPALMLTSAGLSLLEGVPEVAQYQLDDRRISAALARHTLAVQRVALRRRDHWHRVTPERLMKEPGKKIPDALLERDGQRLALEVELTYKTAQRIYIGFADHARAIRDGRYERVEYVFSDEAMRGYYAKLFAEKRWPVYRWNEKTRHYDRDKEMFLVDSFAGLREAVAFTREELPHD